jgi:Raf kinase inhibitor-like YbhB/YbcL family protein
LTGYIFWHNLSSDINAYDANPIFVSSADFTAQQNMPALFTCQGKNINPQLSFANIPDGTQSLAIDMVDTNSSAVGYVHWFIWGISPNVKAIPQDFNRDFVLTGLNYYGTTDYSGPCPTSGTHHYRFEVYALDNVLGLKNGADFGSFQSAMTNHIISYGTFLSSYQYQSKAALQLSAKSNSDN